MDTLIIKLKILPNASRDEVLGWSEGRLKIRICLPPHNGKANAHLIKFLSKLFKVAKSNIHIVSGKLSRLKTVEVQAPKTLPGFMQNRSV